MTKKSNESFNLFFFFVEKSENPQQTDLVLLRKIEDKQL